MTVTPRRNEKQRLCKTSVGKQDLLFVIFAIEMAASSHKHGLNDDMTTTAD